MHVYVRAKTFRRRRKRKIRRIAEREGDRIKNTKSPQYVESYLLISGYPSGTVASVGWLDGAVNRARGVRFRACEDRSDVLFDLSAAEDRRLFTPESARDQSEAYLMLMPFFNNSTLQPPCMRHAFVSPGNSVFETPDTASIIVARSAPRPKSLSAA
ncbi:hypothetical protein BJV74DRAFT_814816, partial [Russula compacta]